MTVLNNKFADDCDSVLFPMVRERLDAEIAASEKHEHEALESAADLLCEIVRKSTPKCQRLLSTDKKLTDAYAIMRMTVEERVKPERGKVCCGSMTATEALKIIIDYYEINQPDTTIADATQDEPQPSTGVKSIFDVL